MVAPQSGGSYPMSLSGNRSQDFMDYAMNPDEFSKAVVASHAPVDSAKMTAQMRDAVARGDYQTAAAIKAQLTKANFIEPTNIREGGAAIFNDGSNRIMTSPKTEVGMQNDRDAQGNVIGQSNVPGALAAIGQSEAARAGGKAADSLPYETAPTYNNTTGQTELIPRSATLAGGYPTTAPLGAPQFADTSAKAGAGYFTGLAESAADAPNRVYALNQMKGMLASRTQFGPGTDAAVRFADFANGIGKAIGFQGNFNGQNVTNVNEFNKRSAQYSARAAADLGLSGSDKRLDMSVAATPNGHMTNQALGAIIPQMIGFEAAKQGMANAGAAYAQAHPGPNAQGQFLSQWRAAYDPQVFQTTSLPANEQGAAIGRLAPPQRAAMARKWQTLKSLGAF